DGKLTLTASETFIRRNTNRGIDDALADMPNWIAIYDREAVPTRALAVMAAFGCNFEGEIAVALVIDLVSRAAEIMAAHGATLEHLRLADTMGWATPEHTKRLVSAVRERWPDVQIRLHMHDTRGLALANIYAAMALGVREFDSSVGGLGGCPFAATRGAAGNV